MKLASWLRGYGYVPGQSALSQGGPKVRGDAVAHLVPRAVSRETLPDGHRAEVIDMIDIVHRRVLLGRPKNRPTRSEP